MAQLPINQSNEDVSNEIRQAAVDGTLLNIRYRAQDQEITERTVEPYEIKKGKLFAYCTNKGGIRAFSLPSIEAAKQTETPFKARYTVRIDETTYIK